MHYNFFADDTDKINIIDFILKETDLQIFDHASAYGEDICQYKRTKEIISKFDLVNGGKFAVNFQLWSPRFKGQPQFVRVTLDPKRCKGHTFRYSTYGFGLIQLYFAGVKNNILDQSHIGHLNEKGACRNEGFTSFRDYAHDWDWIEIQKTSRMLKYQIHNKMSIRKAGSLGILAGADTLSQNGVKLWGG